MTLTASTVDGRTRNYTVTVVSNVAAVFDRDYAKPRTPLTVVIQNAPELSLIHICLEDNGSLKEARFQLETPILMNQEYLLRFSVDIEGMDLSLIHIFHIIYHKIGNANYSTGIFMIPGKFVERDSARRIGLAVPFV